MAKYPYHVKKYFLSRFKIRFFAKFRRVRALQTEVTEDRADRWFCADLIYIIAALDLPHRVGVAETPNYYAGPHFLVTVGSFRFVVPDPGTGDGLG